MKQSSAKSMAIVGGIGALLVYLLTGMAYRNATAVSMPGLVGAFDPEDMRRILSLITGVVLPILYDRLPWLRDLFQRIAPDDTRGEIAEKLDAIRSDLDEIKTRLK